MKMAIALAAALVAAPLMAEEHLKEQAAAPARGEQPAQPEADGDLVGSKAWTERMNQEFAETVERYLPKQPQGAFPIKDERLNKDWRLKLIKVDRKRVVHLGGQRFFACADFKTVEKGKKDTVDLDFYAAKRDGVWTFDDILIHKVNGRPRYTYDDKNGRVPAAD